MLTLLVTDDGFKMCTKKLVSKFFLIVVGTLQSQKHLRILSPGIDRHKKVTKYPTLTGCGTVAA